MTLYARILPNGLVAETHRGTPEFNFVPEIAALFEPVPEAVVVGDTKLEDGSFARPPSVEPEVPVIPRTISEDQLLVWMTRSERIAYSSASSHPVINDFQGQLKIRALDLEDTETIEAIDALVTQAVLSADRAAELKLIEF